MSKVIFDTDEFLKASQLVSNVVYQEERLPNQVFKAEFRKRVFLEFASTLSGDFWCELERLMDRFDDDFVILGVLDPHPVNYYYKEFARYNWCKLDKGTTYDEYWNALNQIPKDSPADTILFNSSVVVWLSSSMKWAIWGEYEYGICILSFNEEMGDYTSDLWFTFDEAITDLVSLEFYSSGIPAEIMSKLKQNYGS